MSAPNDGGSITANMEPDNGGGLMAIGGLSIRDWFAGMALQGYCARPDLDKECQQGFSLAAYDQADAMIAARERKEGA